MHLHRGQVVAPGVAVAHGVQAGGIGFVDEAVVGHVMDVVDGVVGGLAVGLEVVPEQAIEAGVGLEEVGAAQEGQLLVERSGHLVLEGEEGAGRVVVHVGRLRHNPGLGVGPRLVAEQAVEAGQAGGSQQQGLVGSGVGAGALSKVLGSLEDGLVELNEADVLQVVLVSIEGHRADVRATRLLEHAGVGGRGLAIKGGRKAGLVRVDLVEDALDPAHNELRDVTAAAVGLELRRVGRARPLVRHPGMLVGRSRPIGSHHIGRHVPPTDVRNHTVGHPVALVRLLQLFLPAVAHEEELVGQGGPWISREVDGVQAETLLVDLPSALRGRGRVIGR